MKNELEHLPLRKLEQLAAKRRTFLALAAFASPLFTSVPAKSSPVVRTELEWHGRCENRSRLEAELSERGVQLVRVSRSSDPVERLKLVAVVESGGDFGRPTVVARDREP